MKLGLFNKSVTANLM